MWIAVPIAAFAATIIAIAGHLVTREIAWYQAALIAAVAGVATALLAFTVGLVDAENEAAGTEARETGMRQVAFEALALVLLAASATVMFVRYERHAELADVLPLALALLAGAALGVAGWYGRALLRLTGLARAIVEYRPRHLVVAPRAPHPRPMPTIG
ncbi:MAG TPA: DUF2231 domain-containing protein, partial [Kofleriaceae bacterium]